MDTTEAPEHAAVRETLEESNVTATVRGLLGYQNLKCKGDDWMALVFLCDHVSGTPEPDGRETDAAGYFTEDEIESMEDEVETWCRWIALRVLRGEYALVPEAEGNPYQPKKGFL